MDPRFEWQRDAYGKEKRNLYLLGLFVGCIIPITATGPPFRAWLMTDDEGDRVGDDKFETEDAARDAVYAAALERVTSHESR